MIFANNSLPFQHSLTGSPQLVSVGLEEDQPSFMLRSPHQHRDSLEILLIDEGAGLHRINGKEYYASVGDVLVFNAGCLHERASTEGIRLFSCTATNVCFPGQAVNELVPPGYASMFSSGGNFDELRILCTLMYDYTLRTDSQSAEIANYLLRIYLIKVHSAIKKQGALHPPIDKNSQALFEDIKQYLDEHYQDDSLSLKSMADALHVSHYHVSHVFKDIYNLSPMQYVAHRRIGDAQSLLIETNLTVTQIAMLIGFSNANQFHHTFLRLVGVSPQKYRKYWST